MGGRALEIATIVCFYWGDWNSPYGNVYVNRLYRGFLENLERPFRFICFTDIREHSQRYFMKGIDMQRLNCPHWRWNLRKLYAYNPEHQFLSEQVIICDLDVVVTGDMTDIVECGGDFITCRGAYHPDRMGGSLMSFRPDKMEFLWHQMVRRPAYWEEKTKGSERRYFNLLFKEHNQSWQAWEDLLPGQVLSYKRDCGNGLPSDSRLVRFHGKPRPHEVNDQWVKENWI
jgi:hypothetical protein